MPKFKMKIDEKSLFFGLHNDYERGQTATVSTPINQSKDESKWHKDIIKLFSSGLNSLNLPDVLVNKCLNKTTSKANSKLLYFFEFKNIFLDGIALETSSSFAMYVKEETDNLIKNKINRMVNNTHLGRQKLHYPITLLHKTDHYNVDNSDVLNCILRQNGGFAFVVRGFEVDPENKSLNFLTSLIALKGTLLSNVFKIQKGVGKKLLVNEIDLEEQDISPDGLVFVSDYECKPMTENDFDKLSKTKVENGKHGEQYVFDNIKKLINDFIDDIYHTSEIYPMSPYDIEYIENGVKKYLEVKATSGTTEVFNMSSGEIKFMEKYKENYTLILVTEVNSQFPKVKKYDCDKILAMRKVHPLTRFYPQ